MVILLNDFYQQLQADDPEEKRITTGVSWQQYEALLADLGDSNAYRVAYLDGVLEIVAPSRRHESGKTRIGTLIEVYFLETETEYFPTGSTTFRKEERQAGGEPDESYCIGTDKEFPDLAVEVVITSGGINRLELYRRLEVREVWFWQNNNLSIYHKREDIPFEFISTFGYEKINQSELLPDLDLEILVECLKITNPLAAAREFRQKLRQKLKKAD